MKKCTIVRAAYSTTYLPHSPSVIVFVFAAVVGIVVVWGGGGIVLQLETKFEGQNERKS